MTQEKITALIGKENENLLTHTCKTVTKDLLHLPSPTFIDDVISLSNRSNQTLCSTNITLTDKTGRLIENKIYVDTWLVQMFG